MKKIIIILITVLFASNVYADRRGEGHDCFYGRQDVTAPWEKELGIFQE